MWIFGKKPDKKKDAAQNNSAAVVAPAQGSKEEKVQALLAQMRELRAEIGEENLQRLAEKLQLDTLKKQIRHDIDNDPKKRERLLDELKYQVRDKGDL